MIKTSFNVTHIKYTLIYLIKGELKQVEGEETLLHKRTQKYLDNYLTKKAKKVKALGYDIESIKTEKVTVQIPYQVALDYKI